MPLDDELREPDADDVLGGGLDGRDDGGGVRGLVVARGLVDVDVGGVALVVGRGVLGGAGSTTRDGGRVS